MRLIIIRHGETKANIKRVCQGQTHGSLNDNGLAQAIALATRLKHTSIDACYSSDLNRAMQTAEQIMAFHNNIPITPDNRLRERYFGDFQGKVFPADITDFAPNSQTETPEQIKTRLLNFLNEISVRHAKQTILIVSHGFTLKVLFAILTNDHPTHLSSLNEIDNASVSIIEKTNNQYKIILQNDITHLYQQHKN